MLCQRSRGRQHDALIVGASRIPWFVPIASTILAKGSVPQGMVTIGEVVFLRPHCERLAPKSRTARDRAFTVLQEFEDVRRRHRWRQHGQ